MGRMVAVRLFGRLLCTGAFPRTLVNYLPIDTKNCISNIIDTTNCRYHELHQ